MASLEERRYPQHTAGSARRPPARSRGPADPAFPPMGPTGGRVTLGSRLVAGDFHLVLVGLLIAASIVAFVLTVR
jgi:hypothetical protein